VRRAELQKLINVGVTIVSLFPSLLEFALHCLLLLHFPFAERRDSL
jgi:hypothetical protein